MTPVDGETAHFSVETGFTAPIKVLANASVEYVTPTDATYVYVMVKKTRNNTTPLTVTINGFDITKSLPDHVLALYSDVSSLDTSTQNLTKTSDSVDFIAFSNLDEHRGNINGSFVWENCLETSVYKFKHKVIPVKSGDEITVIGDSGAPGLSYVAFLKSYTSPTNGASADMSTETGYTSRFSIAAGLTYNFVCPSDANYMYVLTLNNNKDVTPQTITINTVIMTETVKGNLQALNELWNTTVNWAAMGDSITEGYYS